MNSTLPTTIDNVRVLRLAGRAAEAQTMLREIVNSPNQGGIWPGQLGVDLNFLGMHAEAEKCIRRGLLGSLSDFVRYTITEELYMSLYAQGKYHEALALHRINRDLPRAESLLATLFSGNQTWVELLKPKMLGIDEPVAGKSILLLGEGGFGDMVLFSRYIDALFREGAREVKLEAFDFWADVIRPRPGLRVARMTAEARTDEAQRCDRVASPFHLWARYQSSPYFPQENPAALISLDAVRSLPPEAAALLAEESSRLKVGLVWRSTSGARHEPYRSMQLAQLAGVLGNPDCRFYSLQVGDLSDDERALMQAHDVVDLGPYLHNFGDTGRAYEQLDLFISIDTGAAHLAGALNRPVWVLLSQACDHRWYDCRRYTPWYASMRLYRQERLGDWSVPLADMSAELAQLAAEKRA
ncbi:glycosyltransferase family 9 protein [Caballeronia grimmiae]|uniref:Uncharacterized protein n=1 Tax=Caballeronia grimmiae TaxID=1071679 RepID=A0A069P2E2_9BURK|nr:hypothetical protein [Caballeronia grimmiae]KDR34840.1 hypothetical protein BG57_02495 [Caballeronia grimmiae]GGD64053.1 hypothetical protein GCM10010985_17660 [Caballeronia grimmiae]